MSPDQSLLISHNERGLLVKILAELRVMNMLLSQEFNAKDDISRLRDEALLYANTSSTDL